MAMASARRARREGAYRWLDGVMADREWAAGAHFSLADCAAAPFLFYADWTHRIDPAFANVIAYRRRLLARPCSRARWRKRAPVGRCSRSVRPIATERRAT
jgi:glutathione S-transferase